MYACVYVSVCVCVLILKFNFLQHIAEESGLTL